MATQQRTVALILARELAVNVATAMFIVDPEGTLVFYNERAERILGRRYAETGALGPDEWGSEWRPEDPEGRELDLGELPLMVALRQRRPAHRGMLITGSDGSKRPIEVTAFPLFAREDELIGAVAIFWQDEAQ
jgi:PAS domain S-box-containing protein